MFLCLDRFVSLLLLLSLLNFTLLLNSVNKHMKEAFRSNSIFYTHKKDVCFENNQRGRKALILPMVSPKKKFTTLFIKKIFKYEPNISIFLSI